MSNITLFVLNTPIRTDAEGRYSLNDLHRAAGGESKHRPGEWLRNAQTAELIAEIETAGISAVKSQEGRGGGTYVVKELVYSYAMWISPAFNLKVIRAYDSMATGAQTHTSASSALDAATSAFKLIPTVVRAARMLGLDKNAAAISANNAVAKMTGTNVMHLLGHTHLAADNQEALFYTPTELGRQIGISGRAFNMLLAEAGLQAKKGEHWAPLATAEGFCRIMDTGKRHGDGTMIQQIKWHDGVLALVQKDAA